MCQRKQKTSAPSPSANSPPTSGSNLANIACLRTIKNPEEKLEELRRSSLVEFEHLKAAETAIKKISSRDMPEHAVVPHGSDGTHELEHELEEPAALKLPEQAYATGEQPHTPSALPSSDHTELSPTSQLPPQTDSLSTQTAEAEIEGHASTTGKPVFAEPDFAPVAESIETLRKSSPGSFSADALHAGEHLSPSER